MGRFSLPGGAATAPRPDPAPPTSASPTAQAPSQPAAPAQPATQSKAGGSGDARLDLRVKLHGRLIDELDLAKLDKLSETELRHEVLKLVSDFARAERMALNTADLQELGSSIYDEMVGLGPLEPLLKDESINDILINGPFQVYVERRGELE